MNFCMFTVYIKGGARGITDIAVRNGFREPNSKPGQGCLCFTYR